MAIVVSLALRISSSPTALLVRVIRDDEHYILIELLMVTVGVPDLGREYVAHDSETRLPRIVFGQERFAADARGAPHIVVGGDS